MLVFVIHSAMFNKNAKYHNVSSQRKSLSYCSTLRGRSHNYIASGLHKFEVPKKANSFSPLSKSEGCGTVESRIGTLHNNYENRHPTNLGTYTRTGTQIICAFLTTRAAEAIAGGRIQNGWLKRELKEQKWDSETVILHPNEGHPAQI